MILELFFIPAYTTAVSNSKLMKVKVYFKQYAANLKIMLWFKLSGTDFSGIRIFYSFSSNYFFSGK